VAPDAARPTTVRLFVALVRTIDVLLLAASGSIASWACFVSGIEGAVGGRALVTLTASFAAILTLNALHGYTPEMLRHFTVRLRAILLAMGCGGAAGAACLILMPHIAPVMRLWLLFWMLFASLLATAAASFTTVAARSLTDASRLAQRVAVVGMDKHSRTCIARMEAHKNKAVSFIGQYTDDVERSAATSGASVLGGLQDLVERSRRERIDAIVLALPLHDIRRIMRSRVALASVTSDIYLASEALDLCCKTARVDRLGDNAVVKIASRPLNDWQMLQKTIVDRTIAVILLVFLLPVLLLIGLAIRLDSKGPALFRQPRQGFNNALFNVFKFRTMYHHLTDVGGDQQTTRNDARITRIGRFLRKTSLDELPQLLNVLRGEMSLVGPRPHAPNTKAGNQLFHEAVAEYVLRHRVKPGITGWAQVNGWRGETRTREQLERRVAHDLYYIDNWSLAFDFKILLLTALREVNSKVAF
jgi:Undecaprenyl-phosphate glucose phosphotransferase